jgi:uncharacterized protein involved in exopolysaccharide biosynthesis
MTESPNPPDRPEADRNILDYLVLLVKHSRTIIFPAVAVTVLTYLVMFILPNTYTATAILLPPQQNLTMSGQLMDLLGGTIKPGSGSAFGFGGMGGLFGLKFHGDLYVAMIQSNTVADRIIERFQLKELYKKKYLEDTRKTLGKMAKITAGKKDGLITIKVTDKDPQRAAEIANAFVVELDTLLRSLAMQEASGRLAFLEKELATANANLMKAEEALRSFSEKSNVIQLDVQTRGMLQYIAQLRAEIDAKEVQVQVLRQQATSYNYDVVRLETQVKGLKDKLQTAEKQWDQACIGDVCLPTSKMPTLGLEYIRLYRDVKFQEGLYQLYTKMAEIARLDLVRDVAVVNVVDRALPPDKRSNKRLVPTMIAGVIAFAAMALFAFVGEQWADAEVREEYQPRLAAITGYLQPWEDVVHRLTPWRKKKL